MTRDEIVAQVAERLNLTSTTALTRIAAEVTERYRWVLGAVGLPMLTQGTTSALTAIGVRYLTFTGIQKLKSVFNSDDRTLGEVTFDELRNRAVREDPPREYAIVGVTKNTVTIFLDCMPATVYTLSADALVDAAVLGPTDEPVFPEVFHDLLVYGARAIELEKMEKEDLAAEAENKFQRRLSELRYFLAKSAYLSIYQGRTAGTRLSVVQ